MAIRIFNGSFLNLGNAYQEGKITRKEFDELFQTLILYEIYLIQKYKNRFSKKRRTFCPECGVPY